MSFQQLMLDRSALFVAALAATLPIAACTPLPNLNDDNDDNDGSANEDSEPSAQDAKADDAPVEAEPEADAETDGETAASAETGAAPSAEPTEPEEPEQNYPVTLSDLRFDGGGDLWGSSVTKLIAKAKVEQPLTHDTFVWVKSRCLDDDVLQVATTQLHGQDVRQQLHHTEVGDTLPIEGMLYRELEHTPKGPCEFEFRLAGFSGLSIPLARYCRESDKFERGECKSELAIEPPDATEAGAMISSWKAAPVRSGTAIKLDYHVTLTRAQSAPTNVVIKAVCPIGERRYVDVRSDMIRTHPFEHEAGETFAHDTHLFASPQLGELPDTCDVTISYDERFGQPGRVLREGCIRGTTIADGRCDGSKPPFDPPHPANAETYELANVELTPAPSFLNDGSYQLNLRLDVTAKHAIMGMARLEGQLTCRVGKSKLSETVGLYSGALQHLKTGETARIERPAFITTALPNKPRRCKLTMTATNPVYGEKPIEIGEYCLRKDKVRRC